MKNLECCKSAIKTQTSKEMIGKIVVIKVRIGYIDKLSEKFYVTSCFPSFHHRMEIIPLGTKWQKKALDELFEYEGCYEYEVYIKGLVYYNDYMDFVTIKPLNNQPFVVGYDFKKFKSIA